MAQFRLLIDYDVVVYGKGSQRPIGARSETDWLKFAIFPRIAQITSSTMSSGGRWRSTSAASLRSNSGSITPTSRSRSSTSIRLTGGVRSLRAVYPSAFFPERCFPSSQLCGSTVRSTAVERAWWRQRSAPDPAETFPHWAKQRCAAPAAGRGGPGLFVEPVTFALLLIDAGLFAPLF